MRPRKKKRKQQDERSEFGHVLRRGQVWYIRFQRDGREVWESSRSTDRKVAEKLLERRRTELDHHVYQAPMTQRTIFEDLVRILLDDYQVKENESRDRVERALPHLRAFFGRMRARAITTDRLTRYVRSRLDEGAGRSTVKYELVLLRRAFNLAKRSKQVADVPDFPGLGRIDNARQGFFSEADLARLLPELPESLRPLVEVAYITGWRLRSELLTRTWATVDLRGGSLRLERGGDEERRASGLPLQARLAALAGTPGTTG